MSETELMRRIGENLQSLMHDWGMSQKELADETGISTSTINFYVNGERMPSLKNLIIIAYALECELTDLVDVDELIF